MLNNKSTLLIALISGFLAVLLGAFGAHVIKNMVDAALLDTWKTASFYHFIHTLMLLILVVKQPVKPLSERSFIIVSTAIIVGVLLFSGSLYIYVLSQIKVFAMITPIGGLCLLFAWAYWLLAELKKHG